MVDLPGSDQGEGSHGPRDHRPSAPDPLGDRHHDVHGQPTQVFTSTTFAADLQAGKLTTWLAKGNDAYVFQGPWSGAKAYVARDSVVTFDQFGDTVLYARLWTTATAIAAGQPAPSTESSVGWMLLASNYYAAGDIWDVVRGKFQNQANADFVSRLAKLKAAMTNVLMRLKALDNKSYTWP